MKRFILLSILMINMGTGVRSQHVSLGAGSGGMAFTYLTQKDVWCAFQNIGGLGSVKDASFIVGYENRYGIREGLQTMGAGVVVPVKVGVGSLAVSRFGDHFFSLHTISAGYGHQIDQFSLGVRVNQLQYSMESFGTSMLMVIDVGGVATITPELLFGLQIRNINQSTMSRFTGEGAPSFVQTGFSYRPLPQLKLNGEIEYEITYDPVIKAGAEYVWEEKISIRTGINNRNLQQFFGLGMAHRLMNFDYALISHASLGFSHQVSLAYHLSKQK